MAFSSPVCVSKTCKITIPVILDPSSKTGVDESSDWNEVAREQGLGVNAPYLLVELNQGGGAPIATLNITQGTLTTTFTQYEYTLTASEADAITDYTDLEIRMEASCNTGTCTAGSSRDRVEVSWFEFAVEDAPLISPPTLDLVSVISSTDLQLDWTPPLNQTGILSYDIERDSGSGFSIIDNVINGTVSFFDSGLTPDTLYTYRLKSIGSTENSITSNEVSQTTTVIIPPTAFAFPDSDPSVRWVNGLGALPCKDTKTHFCVDEEIRSDLDFIQTIGLGSSNTDTQFYTLSDIADPLQSTDHVLKYTLRRTDVGTNPVGFSIELRQGVTSIVTYTHPQGTLPVTNFALFERTLTTTQADSITDYNDLELTLTAFCTTGCTNQQREKVNVSWVQLVIDQVQVPSSLSVTTVDQTTLMQTWNPPTDNGTSAIIGYQLEREVCNGVCTGSFTILASKSSSEFTHSDTALNPSSLYQYRILAENTEGFGSPSPAKEGVTSGIDITALQTQGQTLEPASTNSFTKLQKDQLIDFMEAFNPNSANLESVMGDLDTNLQPMYQIILGLDNGTYNFDSGFVNATKTYNSNYINATNITEFLNTIESAIRNATDGNAEP